MVILETAEVDQKEFEYAVVVGQLIALLEPETCIEVISAMPSSEILIEMMQSSDMNCSLIHVQAEQSSCNSKYKIPTVETIQQKPNLLLVKKYCDVLGGMKGKPNSIEKLKNSISNILQVASEQVQPLIGLLINLKIVKRYDEQISFRKKVLKQWMQLDLDAVTPFRRSAKYHRNVGATTTGSLGPMKGWNIQIPIIMHKKICLKTSQKLILFR